MTNIALETQLIADTIADSYKPDKIILFGSIARNEGNTDSDIDMLIIKNSNKKRPFRVKEVFESIRSINRQFPLDVIVYTPEEIQNRIALGDYFINRVLNEGRILYESKQSNIS